VVVLQLVVVVAALKTKVVMPTATAVKEDGMLAGKDPAVALVVG